MSIGPPPLSHAALFVRFLRFGLQAFGGPVAQIALIRRELVDQERWVSSQRFNKLLSILQVLPGPEAHELCVHLGVQAKGRIGGLLAGLGFMLPGFVLMMALAWLYTRLRVDGTLLGAVFLGVQAAVLALIIRAVHRIGEHILLDRWLWFLALGALVATLAGASFWIVLGAAGLIYALAKAGNYALAAAVAAAAALLALMVGSFDVGLLSASLPAASAVQPTIPALFWTGLKAGLLTFGGAYTAIPFVRDDAVGRGWMSDAQFVDGLGLAGVLPAPLVIFVTFVGWIGGGPWGAVAMTAGMFLPAFAFSMIFYDRLEAVAEHPRLQHFLAGVAAGVVGLIVATIIDLGLSGAERTPSLPVSLAIVAGALALLYAWGSKLAVPAVLLFGGAIGAMLLTE